MQLIWICSQREKGNDFERPYWAVTPGDQPSFHLDAEMVIARCAAKSISQCRLISWGPGVSPAPWWRLWRSRSRRGSLVSGCHSMAPGGDGSSPGLVRGLHLWCSGFGSEWMGHQKRTKLLYEWMHDFRDLTSCQDDHMYTEKQSCRWLPAHMYESCIWTHSLCPVLSLFLRFFRC